MNIDDLSKGHRTTLRARVQIAGVDRTLDVSVPGRDVWAYQMAKIELQNAQLAHRRAARLQVASPTKATS